MVCLFVAKNTVQRSCSLVATQTLSLVAAMAKKRKATHHIYIPPHRPTKNGRRETVESKLCVSPFRCKFVTKSSMSWQDNGWLVFLYFFFFFSLVVMMVMALNAGNSWAVVYFRNVLLLLLFSTCAEK